MEIEVIREDKLIKKQRKKQQKKRGKNYVIDESDGTYEIDEAELNDSDCKFFDK